MEHITQYEFFWSCHNFPSIKYANKGYFPIKKKKKKDILKKIYKVYELNKCQRLRT